MPRAPKRVPRPRASNAKPSSAKRGYGPAHRRQRDRLLDLRPLCEVCQSAWSTDLHHRDGNPFNRSDDNALMVCEDCHHSRIHGHR